MASKESNYISDKALIAIYSLLDNEKLIKALVSKYREIEELKTALSNDSIEGIQKK